MTNVENNGQWKTVKAKPIDREDKYAIDKEGNSQIGKYRMSSEKER